MYKSGTCSSVMLAAIAPCLQHNRHSALKLRRTRTLDAIADATMHVGTTRAAHACGENKFKSPPFLPA